MYITVFEIEELNDKVSSCRYKDKVQIVDQFDANDFAHGENGFPRSLISQIMHSESLELQEMLIKRLGEVNSSDEFKGMTDEEIVKRCIPRNVQTCASLRDFIGHMEDKGLEKSLSDNKAKLEKLKESVSESSTEPVVDSVSENK